MKPANNDTFNFQSRRASALGGGTDRSEGGDGILTDSMEHFSAEKSRLGPDRFSVKSSRGKNRILRGLNGIQLSLPGKRMNASGAIVIQYQQNVIFPSAFFFRVHRFLLAFD